MAPTEEIVLFFFFRLSVSAFLVEDSLPLTKAEILATSQKTDGSVVVGAEQDFESFRSLGSDFLIH